MVKVSKHKSNKGKKQLAVGRLFRFGGKSPKPVARGGRRAKQLYIPISFKRAWRLSLRRFRTDKNKRSQHRRQLVLSIYGLPIKEIAVAKVRHPLSFKKPAFKLSFSSLGLLLIIVGLIGGVYFANHLQQRPDLELVPANSVPAPTNLGTSVKAPTVLAKSAPVELLISRLGIDASLVSVGQNYDGTIHVPTPASNAGWYNQAPTPGQLGPAIIVGHVDSMAGPAVFWRLREVVPGDIITIKRADNKVIEFKVNAVKQFAADQFPTKEVYGNINYAGIRLITCGGVFNSKTRHYNLNTVVFGTLVPPKAS